MLKKSLPPAILLLLACAACAAVAGQAVDCRLKGGSMVQLAAEACSVEGGTPVTDVVTPSASVPADNGFAGMRLSDDPELAAAQRSVLILLNKPVADKSARNADPERVERAARFDGCRLRVDENMYVDYGRTLSARLHFKISSAVDLRNVSREAYGVLGKISSYGGGLKAHAVYFDERKRSEGNTISISVMEQRRDGPRSFTLPGAVAFWDAPRDDFWMLDGYGYPKDNSSGFVATDRIRIMFIVETADEAAALKKALDEVQALCKP